MQKSTTPQSVDDYLKKLPELQRHTLEQVRKAIRKAAPDAEEIISYGIPAYRQNGILVYFAGFKSHCSFFPGSYAVMKLFGEALKDYVVSKGTIRFPLEKPLAAALVKKMVLERIKENEARQEAVKKKLVSKKEVKTKRLLKDKKLAR